MLVADILVIFASSLSEEVLCRVYRVTFLCILLRDLGGLVETEIACEPTIGCGSTVCGKQLYCHPKVAPTWCQRTSMASALLCPGTLGAVGSTLAHPCLVHLRPGTPRAVGSTPAHLCGQTANMEGILEVQCTSALVL